MEDISKDKENIYVGHYYDILNRLILKIGTTNNLKRRQAEHNRNYKKAKEYTMPPDGSFIYDWHLPLSKYNTLRYEDYNREFWKSLGIGEFVRNDRFCCAEMPAEIQVKIRKTYTIKLT